jgi:transposase
VFDAMNGSKPGRTKAELEARRRLAVQRVNDGWSQKDVAAFLGVHPVTVAKWAAAFRAGGAGGLAAKPTPGRPRLLTADQEAQVLAWLTEKPTAFGFRTDLWTAARVAHLIRERFGVAYHPNYLREWLSERGHSPQKPARRPRQRDPVGIDRWLTDEYPLIEKKSRPSTPTSC